MWGWSRAFSRAFAPRNFCLGYEDYTEHHAEKFRSAGVADHWWTCEELVAMIDRSESERRDPL
jgi:hypothetical protein